MSKMSPYDVLSRLEEISLQMAGPIQVIDMVAEHDSAMNNSAIWMASEKLEEAVRDINQLIAELAELHRAQLKVPKSKRA